MNANTITIGEVRFSYCNLFQPRANQQGQEPKYSVTILVPKSNAAAKAAIDAAIQAAIDAGVAKCWNGVRPPQPSICVHDGDGVRPSDGMPFGDECKGHWVFTASCKAERPPVRGGLEHPADPAAVGNLFGHVRARERSIFPVQCIRKEGRWLWAEWGAKASGRRTPGRRRDCSRSFRIACRG